jgi:hypothetical protein
MIASPESGAKNRQSKKTGMTGKGKEGCGKTTKYRKKDEASSDDESYVYKIRKPKMLGSKEG